MPRPRRPWFRFYVEAVHDRKLRRLTPAHRWLWVAVLAAARQSPEPGRLLVGDGDPFTVDDLADFAALPARDVREGLDRLAGMVELDRDGTWYVPKWQERQYESDDVTERTRKHRSRERDGNVPTSFPGTPSESETETELLLTSSSVINGSRVNGSPDDDDDRFSKVVELVVAGKERDHPPTRNARAWRKVVRANTSLEDGQVIRKLLVDGDTPEAVALFVLGHGDSTKVDRTTKPWCDSTCDRCDGTGWLYDAELDGAVPCPNRTG